MSCVFLHCFLNFCVCSPDVRALSGCARFQALTRRKGLSGELQQKCTGRTIEQSRLFSTGSSMVSPIFKASAEAAR
jgi:hypothetical protein